MLGFCARGGAICHDRRQRPPGVALREKPLRCLPRRLLSRSLCPVPGKCPKVGHEDRDRSSADNLKRDIVRHILQARIVESRTKDPTLAQMSHHTELQVVAGIDVAVTGQAAYPGDLTVEVADVSALR